MRSAPLSFLSSHVLWHLSTVTSPISPFKRMHKWAMKIWSFFKQPFWLDKSQQIRLLRMVASCSGGERVGRTGASAGSITFPSRCGQAAGKGRAAAPETLLGRRRPSGLHRQRQTCWRFWRANSATAGLCSSVRTSGPAGFGGRSHSF